MRVLSMVSVCVSVMPDALCERSRAIALPVPEVMSSSVSSSMKPAPIRELLLNVVTVPDRSWKAMARASKLSTEAAIEPLLVTTGRLAPASMRTPTA
jgi:hypothetical protein